SSLLGRISGQDDFVVGIMAAGQSAAAIPGLVGHCANMLPIRSCTKAGETFEDLVSRMRARVLDAHEHQWLSFGRIVSLLSLRRDPGRLPLVSVVFNMDQGVSQAPTFRGLGAEVETHARAFESYELFVNASERAGLVVLEAQYAVDLFEEG